MRGGESSHEPQAGKAAGLKKGYTMYTYKNLLDTINVTEYTIDDCPETFCVLSDTRSELVCICTNAGACCYDTYADAAVDFADADADTDIDPDADDNDGVTSLQLGTTWTLREYLTRVRRMDADELTDDALISEETKAAFGSEGADWLRGMAVEDAEA